MEVKTENIISFPNYLEYNAEGVHFINSLHKHIVEIKEGVKKRQPTYIVWDLSDTKHLDMKFLPIIGLLLNESVDFNAKFSYTILIYLHEEGYLNPLSTSFNKVTNAIAQKFSDINRYVKETPKYILFERASDNHQYYDYSTKLIYESIKSDLSYEKNSALIRVVSELLANVKMHSHNPRGAVVTQYIKIDNCTAELIISIGDLGPTFKEHIEKTTSYTFEDDKSAVLWALKKEHTSRNDGMGGLGLYLLRKALSELNGELSIISGNGYFNFKALDYYHKCDPNHINLRKNRAHTIEHKLQGNLITCSIVIDISGKIKNYARDLLNRNQKLIDIDLCDYS